MILFLINRSSPMTTELTSIGIDIGKDTLHIVGFSEDGGYAFRKKIKRLALISTFEKLPRCVVGMEACMSAHFISRTLRKLGFNPRIIAAKYAKPFVKGQKNDYNDAEAVAEAVLRPNLNYVQEKSQDQLDLQALHRVRARLVSKRTATINQIRAFLLEQGITVRTGSNSLRQSLFAILENRKDEISPRMQDILIGLYEDWLWLDERVAATSNEIEEISAYDVGCQLLMSVPGVGPIISTALVAAIGNGSAFERGRDLGAWLGLVPRQYSTGDKPVLGKISKAGNRYLRMLLVQAAQVLLMRPKNWQKFSFGGWLEQASKRLHKNKLAIALANKLARIAWSVLYNCREFDTHQIEMEAI
ncbi:IS110 family transposase [Sulfitobacter sp. S45]|uniref:IS110 family transposase n=1 Tax=Sulfitobacter sp. S45 TaxID=3368581 RepID=UPI0037459243